VKRNWAELKKNNLSESLSYKLPWVFLNTGSGDGNFNMLFDVLILNRMSEGLISNPVLRLYAWSEPTLSLGANQKLENNNYHNVPIVKRVTGGQAVLHGTVQNELTYSVCLYYEDSLKTLYKEIGSVLLRLLNGYGLLGEYGYSNSTYLNQFNCFESKTQADIVINNVKVIGSAQYRKRKFVLQHGSIKLDLIRKLSGKEVYYKDVVADLKTAFKTELNISFSENNNSDILCEKISKELAPV